MSEIRQEVPKPKIHSRRKFIGTIGKAGVAIGTGALAGSSLGAAIEKMLPESKKDDVTITPNPEAPNPQPPEPKPQFGSQTAEPLPPGLPEDTLSPEQLQQNHVRVIQSENVQLYLREKAFEFQLFKDTKDGKINEAVIVLVDSPLLNRNAIEQLPEEAKKLYLATHPYPEESTDYEFAAEFINTNILLSEEVINSEFENSQRAKELVEAHPEIKNRIYIFIAVGGDFKPHPAGSLVEPLPQPEVTFTAYGLVYIDTPLRALSGYSLRHEVSHYMSPSQVNYNELNVDKAAIKSLEDAWNDYSLNGDNSKYAFVFVTEEGITITKNQKAQTDRSNL